MNECEVARQQGTDQVREAIELLEAALDGFTPDNGGHPSEYNGICTAEMILRRVVFGSYEGKAA